jgi:hypothetical protein
VTLPVIVGFTTLAVDAAYVYTIQDKLQLAADAAALAGDQWVGSYTSQTNPTPCTGSSASPDSQSTSPYCYYAETLASANASKNLPSGYGTVLQGADIKFGVWSTSGTFTQLASGGTSYANAVQVKIRMTSANGNALSLFFTPLLSAIATGAGFGNFSLTATATAAFTATNGCSGAGCNNGSGFSAVSDLIVVQDVSSSFATAISNDYPQNAEKQCAADFAATANSNSKFGIILFTGNSPQQQITSRSTGSSGSDTVPANDQGGWCPGEWNSTTVGNCSPASKTNPSGTTISKTQATQPYTYNSSDTENGVSQTNSALNSATGSNFQSNMDSAINNIGDCSGSFGSSNPQYSCSGSNLSSGLQAAINQFCPASGGVTSNGCLGGTLQIVLITDGVSNCSTSGLGTSVIPGQSGKNSSGTLCPSGSGMTGGNGLLLSNDYSTAIYAGSLGITLSTIYYDSGSGGDTSKGPDGLTYAAELQKMVTNANTALTSALGTNALTTDLQQICSGGANANKPRLVL